MIALERLSKSFSKLHFFVVVSIKLNAEYLDLNLFLFSRHLTKHLRVRNATENILD